MFANYAKYSAAIIANLVALQVLTVGIVASTVKAQSDCPNTAYGWNDGRGGSLGESVSNIYRNRRECYCMFDPNWIWYEMGIESYREWSKTCGFSGKGIPSICRINGGQLINCFVKHGDAKLNGEIGSLATATFRDNTKMLRFYSHVTDAAFIRIQNDMWQNADFIGCEKIPRRPWTMVAYKARQSSLTLSIGGECGE